jgi:MSHA biogenesis protein MshQ
MNNKLSWIYKVIYKLYLFILAATLLVNSPGICSADIEPNNTCSAAEELVLDYSGNGQLKRNGSDEFDFFYFTVPLDGTIAIAKSGNHISTTLYNSACSSVLASGDSITYSVVSGSTYKIRLQATNNGKRSYTLAVSYIPITPIAEYRFDECQYSGSGFEALDETGTYNAQAENGVNSNIPGVVDRFADMQANTHNFRPATTIPLTSTWSISVWFKMPFVSTQRYHVLGAMAGGNDLLYVDRNNNFRWGVYTANPSSQLRNGTFQFGSLTNGWHHLVLVGNTGTTSLYIDGSFQDNVTLQSNGQLDYIGTSFDGYGTSGAQGFGLPLDECIVYNQTISPSLINVIYNNQAIGNNWDGTSRTSLNCSAIDHYEIHHDGSALTCEPENITIKACANADCSLLYTTSTDVTLSPAGWIGGDSKTFTGSSTYQLFNPTAGSVTLEISSSNPAGVVTCFNNLISGDCTLPFHDAGFIFDIPDQIACKTSTDITIKAVRKDDETNQCIPSFANRTENINLWSTYISPAIGTESVTVNSTAISGSSPGTAVSLTFDASGESTFTVFYPDAGSVQLDSSFTGSGSEAGLVMTGLDTFISQPAGLCVYSDDANSDCISGDETCSLFTKAGQAFNLKVKGVCWEIDGETDTAFCDNVVTPNFELNNIIISQNLIAPGGGSSGILGVTSFDMAAVDNGEHLISQNISEVGVFTFTADPPNYLGLGDVISTSTSANIGIFTPDRFSIIDNTPSFDDGCAPGNFTYISQEFGFATDPLLTVTAVNTGGVTTNNYGGSFWKLPGLLINRSYNNGAATASTLTRSTDGGNVTPGDTANYDGDGILTIVGDRFTYSKPYVPESPFGALINLDITAADLTDNDGICYDPDSDNICDGYQINNIAGTDLHWGRLNIQSNFGPETENLSLPLTVQYYDGSDFTTHIADDCSQVGLSFNNYTDNLNAGDTCVQDNGNPGNSGEGCVAAGPVAEQFEEPPLLGDFNLYLLAPGTTNNGSVDITVIEESNGSWLQYDWDNDGNHDNDPTGTATFGIYRANDRIINWLELVR